MKNWLLIIISWLYTVLTYSQVTGFEKSFSGGLWTQPYPMGVKKVVESTAGNFILAGGCPGCIGQVGYAATDSAGNLLWGNTVSGTNFKDRLWDAVATPDSGAILAGHSVVVPPPSPKFENPLLIKLRKDGSVQWCKSDTGGAFSNFDLPIRFVSATPDGNYLLMGNSYSGLVIAKFTIGGTVLWAKEYSFPGSLNNLESTACATPDGGLVVLFPSWSVNGSNGFVIMFNSQGVATIQKIINAPSNPSFFPVSVCRRQNGGFAIAGSCSFPNDSTAVIKLDSLLNVTQSLKFSNQNGLVADMVADTDDALVLAGQIYNPTLLQSQYYIIRIDSSGYVTHAMQSAHETNIFSVLQHDSHWLFAGTIDENKFYFLRTDDDFSIPCNSNISVSATPADYTTAAFTGGSTNTFFTNWFDYPLQLNGPPVAADKCIGLQIDENDPDEILSIDPNPAMHCARIRFNNFPEKEALFSVTDISGKELHKQKLEDEQLELDLSGWGRGIYFVRLDRTGQPPVTGKLVIQ